MQCDAATTINVPRSGRTRSWPLWEQIHDTIERLSGVEGGGSDRKEKRRTDLFESVFERGRGFVVTETRDRVFRAEVAPATKPNATQRSETSAAGGKRDRKHNY